MTGMVLKYAKIALRSLSVMFLNAGQGMGGRRSRPFPMRLPVRIVAMKFCSVQSPSPVSLSGVRFLVKLTPHGPDHAVIVEANDPIQGPGEVTGDAGIFMSCGWPES